MVSPNLIKRQGVAEPLEFNDNTKRLFQIIYSEKNRKGEESSDSEPKIKVSELISKLSFFYEKIRNAVDYDEDHLLRKNAISRILRRQVVIEGVIKEVDSLSLSKHLLTELIRGGYLPNNQIPETKITEVAVLLDKYIKLKDQIILKINSALNVKADISGAKQLLQKKNNIIRFLLNMAACEIEDNLSPDRVKKMIVSSMFDVLRRDIDVPENSPYKKDLEIQIYLSIGRKFLKLDKEMLSFVLFKYYNDTWLDLDKIKDEADKKEKIAKIASRIDLIDNKIQEQLGHVLAKDLDKIVRRYALYFTVLSDAIGEDPVRAYKLAQEGDKQFSKLINKTCHHKYKHAKSRLWRAALRSIIYIFLTKSIFVFLIEVPAIKWFGEELNPISLGINVAFPAVLLFLIVLFTNKPGSDNTAKIFAGIRQVTLLGNESKQPIYIKQKGKRGFFTNLIFNLIYTAAFVFSLFMIVRFLNLINFTWVSVIVFLFFLAFVSFFSIIVSRGIRELMIVERRENLVTFLIDLFYMPIILVGRWLSNNMSRVNVFIFVFDFIIEAPFKILVDVAEDWTKYVRERRDNMES
jgi:hypothetical protein